jgi:hypothetical protein
MWVKTWLRLGMIGSVIGLSLLESGCSNGPDADKAGNRTTATPDSGGPVTTASPGGANVGPEEGTPGGVR